MKSRYRIPFVLSWLLACLMAVQSSLGLIAHSEYRDVRWIAMTWYGNDAITLILAVPLLVGALVLLGRRVTVRRQLLWLGVLGYGLYNYAYYLLGTSLNRFFILYLLAFVVSVSALITGLAAVDRAAIASAYSPRFPVRLLGGYLVFVALGLSAVWLGMWVAYAYFGVPTPVAPDAFRLVAALDTGLMVPAMLVGGILLWSRHPWGHVIAPLAAIQGALYLLVLTVNSFVFISVGLAKAPGELPMWGPLLLFTGATAITLLVGAGAQAGANSAER